MMKGFLTMILLFFTFLTFAQIEVEVYADRDTVMVGEEVKLTYRIIKPENVELNSLDFSPLKKTYNWGNLFSPDQIDSFLVIEVVDGGAFKINNNNLKLNKGMFNGEIPLNGSIRIKINKFGIISLPKPNVNNKTNVLGDFGSENVLLIDAPQGETGLNPDQGIVEEEGRWTDYLKYVYVYLGFAAFLMSLYFIITYLRKGKKGFNVQKVEIILPADVVAYRDLDLLKDKELWQNGDTKGYHTELTRIMRQYIEDRYEIQALEMTSNQLKKVMNQKEVDPDIVSRFDDILQIADKVKFAKGDAGPEINEQFMSEAYSIVTKTKEIEKEIEEEK